MFNVSSQYGVMEKNSVLLCVSFWIFQTAVTSLIGNMITFGALLVWLRKCIMLLPTVDKTKFHYVVSATIARLNDAVEF